MNFYYIYNIYNNSHVRLLERAFAYGHVPISMDCNVANIMSLMISNHMWYGKNGQLLLLIGHALLILKVQRRTRSREPIHLDRNHFISPIVLQLYNSALSNPVNPSAPSELIVPIAKRHHSFSKCKLNSGIFGITQ